MKQIQGWHILDGDKTLKRALQHEGITEIKNYQKEQLDVALNYVTNFNTAIDIGANYGIMSYHLSSKFESVHSFEINNEVFECLQKNKDHFELTNVNVYDCGLGDVEKTVAINYTSGNTFSTHVDPSQSFGNAKVSPLDKFDLKNIGFIKIDAEGYEPFILDGAMRTITRDKPIILYERKRHTLRYGRSKDEFLNKLSKYGYKELAYIGSKNALIGVE